MKNFAEGEKLEICQDRRGSKKRKRKRKSVLTDKHFCHYKVKYKANAEQKNYDQRPRFSTKEDKGHQLGSTGQVCQVFLRE